MQHCDIHFVGSIPLASAGDVFGQLAVSFGRHLHRIPDGETGIRINWLQFQDHVFAQHPAFEAVKSEGDWRSDWASLRTDVQYRLRDGVDPENLQFDELGYASNALDSYAKFRRLKQAGVVAKDTRFMVAVPSTYSVMSWGIASESRLAVEGAYQGKLIDEIRKICARIPHDDLAIQWDCAHDMQAFDGARRAYFSLPREGIIERLVALGSKIPTNVELGYHFCYGSFGGRHFVEPKDMRALVNIGNGVLRGASRTVNWLHMPVPIERFDDAYFAPLKNLTRRNGTTIYLGLIHESDGVERALQRIAAAERFLAEFGLSAECGFGRKPPEVVAKILQVHREVLAACCSVSS